MGLSMLKANFWCDVVFRDGAISTQSTFPFGSAEDVAAEAPVEHIALYRTTRAYRY